MGQLLSVTQALGPPLLDDEEEEEEEEEAVLFMQTLRTQSWLAAQSASAAHVPAPPLLDEELEDVEPAVVHAPLRQMSEPRHSRSTEHGRTLLPPDDDDDDDEELVEAVSPFTHSPLPHTKGEGHSAVLRQVIRPLPPDDEELLLPVSTTMQMALKHAWPAAQSVSAVHA